MYDTDFRGSLALLNLRMMGTHRRLFGVMEEKKIRFLLALVSFWGPYFPDIDLPWWKRMIKGFVSVFVWPLRFLFWRKLYLDAPMVRVLCGTVPNCLDWMETFSQQRVLRYRFASLKRPCQPPILRIAFKFRLSFS